MEKEFIGDLILLRGIPGSGKSTLAEIILDTPQNSKSHILSADDFFTDEDGNYNFDASKLKVAHNNCQFRCYEKMRQGIKRIVIANTFTQEWEMKEYFEMAKTYNYRVHTIIVENRHEGINQHGVPDDKLEVMKKRFEIKL
jgi:predicted kinase